MPGETVLIDREEGPLLLFLLRRDHFPREIAELRLPGSSVSVRAEDLEIRAGAVGGKRDPETHTFPLTRSIGLPLLLGMEFEGRNMDSESAVSGNPPDVRFKDQHPVDRLRLESDMPAEDAVAVSRIDVFEMDDAVQDLRRSSLSPPRGKILSAAEHQTDEQCRKDKMFHNRSLQLV